LRLLIASDTCRRLKEEKASEYSELILILLTEAKRPFLICQPALRIVVA
jgi:hypothetical protein